MAEQSDTGDVTYDELVDVARRFGRREIALEAEAARYTLAQLAGGLRLSRGVVRALADGWTQEQLWFQPPHGESAEDRWSATEAITHLIATQNWYLLHIGRLLGLREHFDVMPRGLGDLAHNDAPRAQLSADLAAATARMLTVIGEIPPDASLAAQRDSRFFGPLGLRGWVLLAIVHDIDHAAQIQRLTEQPGFPTAG